MFVRTDAFRDAQVRPPAVPMNAYRNGDTFTIDFDLPGVDDDSIDVTVEKDVLSVSAERTFQIDDGTKVVAAERRQGSYRRRLFLGKGLDAAQVVADYTNGVLTVTIPVAEQAKPRKVTVTSGGSSVVEETV